MLKTRLIEYLPNIIRPAVLATIRMVIFSFLFSLILGTITGIWLALSSPYGLKPNHTIYKIINFIVGLIRAFPIIILIVTLSNFTKMLVGTSVGETAAIIPLTIAATPIIAKIIEMSIVSVDISLIEASRSFGASDIQILFKVLFVESFPAIVNGLTSALIMLLGSTTIAGAVGAGGLGSVAISYGYNRFDDVVMYTIVAMLLAIVLLIQSIGHYLYQKIK